MVVRVRCAGAGEFAGCIKLTMVKLATSSFIQRLLFT